MLISNRHCNGTAKKLGIFVLAYELYVQKIGLRTFISPKIGLGTQNHSDSSELRECYNFKMQQEIMSLGVYFGNPMYINPPESINHFSCMSRLNICCKFGSNLT